MKKLYLRGRDKRHDLYHDTVDRLMVESEILNGGSKMPNVHMNFWTKKNIEVAIYQMTGERDGFFHDQNGEKIQASIPSVKEKLSDLKTAWENTCRKAQLEGKSKPKEMDVKLFNQKLVHEAELTVLEEELSMLQKHLKIITDREEEIRNSKVLKYGPVGNISLRNGIIQSIDEMPVKQNEEGTFFINCDHPKAAPYDGFSTSDYIQHIVKPWNQACQLQAKLNREKANIPLDRLSRGLLRGTNAPVPEMPSECINYKKLVTIEKS